MIQDLKYALRVLRGNPGVTVAALIALAFGIGANTAIFSLMDAVVLRPLPYPQPDRLTTVYTTEGTSRRGMNSSWPMFREWQQQNHVFESLSAVSRSAVNLTGGGDPLRLYAVRVTPEFFTTLGVQPAIGSALDSSGEAVVATHSLWMRRFGGDPSAIGRLLVLDGKPYHLAGVLPEGFHFPKKGIMDEPQVYLPVLPNPSPRAHYLEGIGRLKPGVSIAQAQSDLSVISAAAEQARPNQNRGEGAIIGSLQESLIADSRQTLTVFSWAVGLVLLIACANVSNLLLTQAVRRQREIAIRSAVGATRLRLVRQLLVESLVLSLAGGALGAVLALWGIPLLAAAAPVHTAFSARIAASGIQLNWKVLGYTLAVSTLAGGLFGILPAWHSVRISLATRNSRGERLRGVLVASEVAFSLVLLAGAGLVMKSFLKLLSVDPGFQKRNLLTVEMELPEPKYSELARRTAFTDQVLERLNRLPGVQAAAINEAPLSKYNSWNSFNLPGGDEMGSAGFRAVSAGYLPMMGIPLIRGRLLTPADRGGVGVINRAMAERYWPNSDPIGKTIETPLAIRVPTERGIEIRLQPEQFEIVGIVGNVRHLSLDYNPRPEMYLPYSQMPTSLVMFVMRASADSGALVGAVRREIWAVDRDQPLAAVRTMDEMISQDVAPRRFVLLLLGVFAAVALALAGAGIFGVVLHSVSQRSREIGIRIALGAEAGMVVGMIVRQTMAWIAAGLLAGVAGGLAASRFLASYLYAVQTRDPASFGAAVFVLTASGAIAAFLPARNAARVDPATTLRCE